MAKTFENWKDELDEYAVDKYSFCIGDIEEESLKIAYNDGETPQEYMEWYAEKYDLLNFDEW